MRKQIYNIYDKFENKVCATSDKKAIAWYKANGMTAIKTGSFVTSR